MTWCRHGGRGEAKRPSWIQGLLCAIRTVPVVSQRGQGRRSEATPRSHLFSVARASRAARWRWKGLGRSVCGLRPAHATHRALISASHSRSTPRARSFIRISSAFTNLLRRWRSPAPCAAAQSNESAACHRQRQGHNRHGGATPEDAGSSQQKATVPVNHSALQVGCRPSSQTKVKAVTAPPLSGALQS